MKHCPEHSSQFTDHELLTKICEDAFLSDADPKGNVEVSMTVDTWNMLQQWYLSHLREHANS